MKRLLSAALLVGSTVGTLALTALVFSRFGFYLAFFVASGCLLTVLLLLDYALRVWKK